MKMVVAAIGLGISILAFANRYGVRPDKRLRIFTGTRGSIVNLLVILFGIVLLAWGSA
jgi:hypothetical protein